MRIELLKEGYVFYLHKITKSIIGSYVKGTDFRVDGYIDEKAENLMFFNMLDNIFNEVSVGKTLAVFYDWETGQYVGEIRQEKYMGPYNEERFYEVTQHVTDSNILAVLLTLDRNLEKNKSERNLKQLIDIISSLGSEELQSLVDYAIDLSSKSNIALNQRILQPKK